MRDSTVAVILLCFLLSQVNGLITADAKCLTGYEWTFTSIGQSPCDVAAELASVCAPGGQFDLEPLPAGFEYGGPTVDNANSCRCSTVYYSLLSVCAYCQGAAYIGWSTYDTNCSTIYVAVYPEQIPAGVKVPAYAYQNVSISNLFNVTVAQSVNGPESSAAPSPSSIYSSSSTSPAVTSSVNSNNTPAIVGGVVGGIVGLGVLTMVILYLVFRSKRKQKAQNDSIQQSSKTDFTPNTTASLNPATMSSGSPGSFGKLYDPNDPSTYPSADENLYNPYQRQSYAGNHNATPSSTGNSARNSVAPQATSQNSGGRFPGIPEL